MAGGIEARDEKFATGAVISPFCFATIDEARKFGPNKSLGHITDDSGRIIYSTQQQLFFNRVPIRVGQLEGYSATEDPKEKVNFDDMVLQILNGIYNEPRRKKPKTSQFFEKILADFESGERVRSILPVVNRRDRTFPLDPENLNYNQWLQIISGYEREKKPLEIYEPKLESQVRESIPFGRVVLMPESSEPQLVLKGFSGIRTTGPNFLGTNVAYELYSGRVIMARINIREILDELAGFALQNRNIWDSFLSRAKDLITEEAIRLGKPDKVVIDHENRMLLLGKLETNTPDELKKVTRPVLSSAEFMEMSAEKYEGHSLQRFRALK